VARAKYKRDCEASGQAVVFASGPPPMTVPDWFMAKPDGVTFHNHRRVQSNLDGTHEVESPDFDAVAGRQIGPSPGLTPEQSFELEAEKQRKEKKK
jgi:hypothetical protein